MGKMINGHIIESNVPLPKGGVARIAEYMKVGDSVRVDTRTKANFIMQELRKLGRKGTSRKLRDGHGFRTWRVE